jgi:Nucleotidyltransferase domain
MSTSQEHVNWTAAGSDATAQKTYASVKSALAKFEQERNVEIFLQGSYANSTNIRADSDVDIVVMMKSVFVGASERLSGAALASFSALSTAKYTATDLKRDVQLELEKYYGSARVHRRNKCIKVDASPGYVDADVVPCFQYRYYNVSYVSIDSYVEGISITPDRGGQIVNFPKRHIANGQTKNGTLTQGRYKSTVRQIKRLRNRAVDLGYLADGVAPGYLLECMTYNTPNDRFVSSDSQRLQDVVLWLKHANKAPFLSCDEIHTLFGTDPGKFTVPVAQQIIDALWKAY